MAYPLSSWVRTKREANRLRKEQLRAHKVVHGRTAPSKYYVKSSVFKYGSIKHPKKKKEYRVMSR